MGGLNTNFLHYLLLILIALTTVAAIQVVGVVLVVAMLVGGPGVIALMLSNKFEVMLLIALAVSLLSTVCGVIISYHIDGATSACIVLFQSGGLFVFALIYNHLSKPNLKAGLLQKAS